MMLLAFFDICNPRSYVGYAAVTRELRRKPA